MSDPLASIRALIDQWQKEADDVESDRDFCCALTIRNRAEELSAVLASLPPYPEESLATRILQEQKDLEAHARDTTDVDRLAQIRDSLLKEPQP
jgi:hypothetical protein